MIIQILIPLVILGVLGVIFGSLLGFASKKFAVPEDPLFPKLRDVLPGANCGGCGFAGCDAYARAVASGEAQPGKCPVGGSACTQAMSTILGVETVQEAPQVAFVHCSGTCEAASDRFQYHGVLSCREAAMLPGGGQKACAYGCLGFGSCEQVCPFDAIHVIQGVAVVDEANCKACGRCVKECPKHLISLIPKDTKVRLACANAERGKDVKMVCEAGCIACGLCVRSCEAKAIQMVNNLPKIDAALCTGCGACAEKCPVSALHRVTQEA